MRERQPLRRAAGDAQAGESARPRAERHRVKLRARDPGAGQQPLEHRQHQLAMAVAGALLHCRALPVQPEGDRTPFGGGFEGCDSH